MTANKRRAMGGCLCLNIHPVALLLLPTLCLYFYFDTSPEGDIALNILTARPAFAWTQELNNYPAVPPYCGGNSGQPCLYWKEPYNSSVSLTFYIDLSLYQGGFDFRTAINDAFSAYNGVKAWNPYMYTCYSGPCANSAVGDYKLGTKGDSAWTCGSMGIPYAFTRYVLLGPVEHSGSLYYQFIEDTNTEFNPESYFHWYNSRTWGG